MHKQKDLTKNFIIKQYIKYNYPSLKKLIELCHINKSTFYYYFDSIKTLHYYVKQFLDDNINYIFSFLLESNDIKDFFDGFHLYFIENLDDFKNINNYDFVKYNIALTSQNLFKYFNIFLKSKGYILNQVTIDEIELVIKGIVSLYITCDDFYSKHYQKTAIVLLNNLLKDYILIK